MGIYHGNMLEAYDHLVRPTFGRIIVNHPEHIEDVFWFTHQLNDYVVSLEKCNKALRALPHASNDGIVRWVAENQAELDVMDDLMYQIEWCLIEDQQIKSLIEDEWDSRFLMEPYC